MKYTDSNSSGPALRSLIGSMLIFGTIGIFVRSINLPSASIAMLRGYIGCLCLLGFCLFHKHVFDLEKLRKNLLLLIISGGLIGFNWILLFESYRFTIVFHLSPFLSYAAKYALITATAAASVA